MADIKGALTHKLGPLPVWVWGVGAGVGINVARYYMAKRGAAADENAGLPTDQAGLETIGGGAAGVPSPTTPAPSSGDPSPVFDPSQLPPMTNGEWASRAASAVAKNDGLSITTVRAALDKYLAGTALSPNEEYIVGRAWNHANYPPEGAPAITRTGAATGGGTVQDPGAPTEFYTPAQPPSTWTASGGGKVSAGVKPTAASAIYDVGMQINADSSKAKGTRYTITARSASGATDSRSWTKMR
jgi:hypothetical protein